jgi:hypothetical protein
LANHDTAEKTVATGDENASIAPERTHAHRW